MQVVAVPVLVLDARVNAMEGAWERERELGPRPTATDRDFQRLSATFTFD